MHRIATILLLAALAASVAARPAEENEVSGEDRPVLRPIGIVYILQVLAPKRLIEEHGLFNGEGRIPEVVPEQGNAIHDDTELGADGQSVVEDDESKAAHVKGERSKRSPTKYGGGYGGGGGGNGGCNVCGGGGGGYPGGGGGGIGGGGSGSWSKSSSSASSGSWGGGGGKYGK